MERIIYLRVDVDFNEGLRRGVPHLLGLFEKLNMAATFYTVMGPDTLYRHSNRAKSRSFRRRLVSLNLWKVTRRLAIPYLRSRFAHPMVGPAYPSIIRDVVARGNELGVHGFDHALWADTCYTMTKEDTFRQMDLAFNAYTKLTGRSPKTWGAPNWRCNEHMFNYLEKAKMRFSSDTRGGSPFYPVLGGRVSSVLQLPISLPCLHELVQVGIPRREIPQALESCLRPGYNLLCIHGYYEGLMERSLFETTAKHLRRAGWDFRPLHEAAQHRHTGGVPSEGLGQVLVPGGARPVSCQESFLRENYFQEVDAVPV